MAFPWWLYFYGSPGVQFMTDEIQLHIKTIRSHVCKDYSGMYREAGKGLKHPFLTPGSESYTDMLWDWDSWLSNVALRQVLAEVKSGTELERAKPYERGCIQNFLGCTGGTGYVPIVMTREPFKWPEDIRNTNMHKPVLAQHAAFLVKQDHGEAEWMREQFFFLQAFISFYRNHHHHAATGLYYWQDDLAIGGDNDPCTFGRPAKSSGSIFLNCLMYRELLAMVYLAEQLNFPEIALHYQKDADTLKAAIKTHCWDEWLGFFYSVDLNIGRQELKHQWGSNWGLHCGNPCTWPCLIQRVGVWSGFLALWAGIATPEQAERIAREHYADTRTFGAPFGVRTLSKMEKMYDVRASSNPSSWLGPIWGVSNYLTFQGFVRYGLNDAARDLAEKTISLFGRDFERFGALHEYYEPDNGEPVLNRGFQNWNYLVLNMINWYEGKEPVVEF
jgi:putative isomerase